MANEDTPAPKIKGFGMTSAFVVIRDDDQAEIIALNPSDDQIVELTKHWQSEQQKQQDDQ